MVEVISFDATTHTDWETVVWEIYMMARHLELIKRFFHPFPSSVVVDIPKKTLVLSRSSRSSAFWCHMSSSGDQQAMQIVGEVTVTNICKHHIYVTAAKLKKHKAWVQHGDLKDLDSQNLGRYMIPNGCMSDLRFHFGVMPPVREKGLSFKADVAIIDLFGNEHWIKGLEFPYSKRLPF
jgi:hypothetical protein